MENKYPGKFIVIEGIDGSGKATQANLLSEEFKRQGYVVEKIDFPQYGKKSAGSVEEYLNGKYGPSEEVGPYRASVFYACDRYDLGFTIKKWLNEGKIIISDRYVSSNVGHQGGKIKDEKEWEKFVDWLYNLEYGIFQIPKPDVVFLLKTSADYSIKMSNAITDKDKQEKRNAYLGDHSKQDIHEKDNSHLVNALNSYIRAAQKFPDEYKVIECIENGALLPPNVIHNKVMDKVKNMVLSQPTAKGSKSMQIEKQDKFTPVFEQLPFTEEDRYLIEPFFTNLDSSVFGVTFLPPEVIGALCSRTSRAKDDLRLAFLREFVKPFINEGGEYSEALKGLIDFLHKYPAELIFSNPKARDFYITWLAQFGDDSIAQMGGTHLIYTGISQLAIKQIEDMRVGIAPIEKSTRYVDYSSKIGDSYRYYTDPTLEDLGLMKEYKGAMDNLFDTYTLLLAEYVEFLKKKYPNEDEKLLRTKAFDTVRLILPVSTLSQLALFSNGQAFEYMVNRCLDHKLGEVRWTARRAVQELGRIIPAFLRRVDSEDAGNYRKYMSGKGERAKKALQESGFNEERIPCDGPSVKLLEYDPDGENNIIAGLVYGETHEPFDSLLEKVSKMPIEAKEKILDEALKGRKAKYYKIPRAFENANLSFEIMMNIGAWRDLHRHRMHTQMRQRFSIYNGFDVPDGLKEAGLDGKFVSAIQKAEEVFKKIVERDEDIAQYCCTLAHRVRFVQFQNMRSFFWEAELRTIPQGHPDYRKIEQEKIRLVDKIYPLIAKHLLVDMEQYEFARREDAAQIRRKEAELKEYFAGK